ncbi:TetR/AcrR family transcriptional regulator [Bifidobacterium choloepi]|uniref:TetR/AcrR family transcriptional regulator n=1 Tax=Bifidobacterium choloepi TaxID=2614131 RepID=A0A6I5NG61_9BIFI|nr:TetR/AcrR family transcriptional regulator [Bifidobacterium choloepi]NEG69363.1 TetR/AcrR family transcriptional regulator [Bifidobacterium choloepi]
MSMASGGRRRNSQDRIEAAFRQLLETKELGDIKVNEITKLAGVNRSTFYANYLDIDDLAETVRTQMFEHYLALYPREAETRSHSYNYLPMFQEISEHPDFFRMMMKLNFDYESYYDEHLEASEAEKYLGTAEHMDYHIAFFKAGINAMLRKWLEEGCTVPPEEMVAILETEYRGRLGA